MRRVFRALGLCAGLSALFWMTTGMGWRLGCPADNAFCGREFVIMLTHVAFMFAAGLSYLE